MSKDGRSRFFQFSLRDERKLGQGVDGQYLGNETTLVIVPNVNPNAVSSKAVSRRNMHIFRRPSSSNTPRYLAVKDENLDPITSYDDPITSYDPE